MFDTGLSPQPRAVLPRIDPADVAAVGPRGASELAATGVASLDGQLGPLIRLWELTADRNAAALAGLPPPWWLHTGSPTSFPPGQHHAAGPTLISRHDPLLPRPTETCQQP